MPTAPLSFWMTVAFFMGAIIGSFLNVVIWRMPRGQNLSVPGSHCPNCNDPIPAYLNIPLFSFLVLGAKCRNCRKPISWRYFAVELLTAILFVLLTRHFGQTLESVGYCLFFAALTAAFFIDLELFIIPDQLNTFALGMGIAVDGWRIYGGHTSHKLMFGLLPHSIFGAISCAGVFVGIQFLGRALFRKESMGDGDVKLARAIGALLPLGLALVSFLLAIAIGAVVGIVSLAFAKKQPEVEAFDEHAEEAQEMQPWWAGFVYLVFGDLLLQFCAFLRIPAAMKLLNSWEGEVPPELEDEEWNPGPTHIPFGPFMVTGALVSVFLGDRLITMYLNWAGIR